MKCKLSEVIDLIGGGTPKTSKPEYWNGNIPWISVKDFNNDFRYVNKTEKSITELGLQKSTTKLLQRGDVIISARGTVGEIATIPFAMAFNQSCYGLRAKKGIVTSDYLYYLIKYNISVLKKNTHGSVFDTITRNTFDNIEVEIPSIKIQQKISSILNDYDKKFELNNAINKNLHDQAIAIFDKSYIAAAEQVPFTSIIQVLGGGTPKTGNPEFWGGEIPFFTPKDVGSPYVFNTEKTISEAGLDHCNSQLYDTNTTFVTARGTVGKVSLAGKPMAMNQSCYALASDSLDPILVYFYTLKAVESLKHKASGAVFDAIVTRDFNTEIISRIASNQESLVLSTTRPMMQAILSNAIENLRLARLRDALLPQLMSGELDVSDLDL